MTEHPSYWLRQHQLSAKSFHKPMLIYYQSNDTERLNVEKFNSNQKYISSITGLEISIAVDGHIVWGPDC